MVSTRISLRRKAKAGAPDEEEPPKKETLRQCKKHDDVDANEMKVEEDENGSITVKAISSSSSSSSSSEEAKESSDGKKQSSPFISVPDSTVPRHQRGYSRMFSPYRTLGIVAGGPFHLLPNQNSSNAMVCAAIGERFQIVQCDKLQPVLVSHAVPGLPENAKMSDLDSGPQKIFHLVSDNSLSVAVVTHGSQQLNQATRVSMFQRTQPTVTIEDICESKSGVDGFSIVDLLHLGKIKLTMSGEKEGKKENAALIAVILSRGKKYDVHEDAVPVVGSDQDDSDSSDNNDSSDEEKEKDKSDGSDKSRGEVVLLIASRTALTIHKRIPLDSFPTFTPRVGVHPPTYVNKIIVGGSCTKTQRDAMVLLNVRTGKMIHVFKCLDKPASKMKSEITCLQASPAIDTIAVGNSKGAVHLVNTRYDKLLFSLGHQSKQGNKSPRITSMSFRNDGSALKYGIAPLAVGRSDGTITVWDLSPPDKDDDDDDAGGVFGDKSNGMGRTVLCEMEHVHSPGGVYKLQYLPQEPLLVSTGSRSNALLMHIFDNPDHSGRILRQRRGHTAPPKCIRYLHPGAGAGGGVLANMADGTDAQACQILSSGGVDRTLRRFSTVRSVLDKEFSQGKGLEKRAKELGMKNRSELLLPTLTALATSEMRSRDWGDLVTIHKDHPFAYVWSSKNGAQSGPILRQDHWNVSAMKKQPPKETHATSVAVSTCGNYALIGTRGGTIYKYNIQSGMTRGTYPLNEQSDGKSGPRKDAGDIRRTFKALEKKMKLSNRASNAEKEELDRIENAKREEHRRLKMRLASHRGHAVTGIAVDSINRTVITVGEDAKLILWSFASHTPHKKSPSQLPAPATKLCHVKDSDLAAIALEDFSIVLFDCAALNIVRRFGSGSRVACHTGPISDVGFSPDGRTLYTSSLDSSIRVWDVPTNACIDWLGFKTPPTSLTVSPTGEFLATTHNEKLGISLWSDRSFFQTVHVDGATSPMEPARMDDPAPTAEIESKDGKNSTNSYFETADPETDEVQISSHETFEKSMGPAVAKEEGLITLSGLPPAHWKNLFHLELVKQRNQPKEPPKKPPSAPFFLQWRPGVNSMGESSGNPEGAGEAKNQDDDGWDAVWSDDDDDNEENGSSNAVVDGLPPIEARGKRSVNKHDEDVPAKKRKVKHHRSHLASLLEKFGDREDGTSFQDVTEYVGTLGPSAIDVSLSGLCNGVHDLEEGLPLLMFAAQWLIEACHSRERFDAVNAYLHRFLYLHSNILAGIDEGVGNDGDDTPAEERQVMHHQRQALATCITALKQAQRSASDALQGEMQNTLCLLRHFSRMI